MYKYLYFNLFTKHEHACVVVVCVCICVSYVAYVYSLFTSYGYFLFKENGKIRFLLSFFQGKLNHNTIWGFINMKFPDIHRQNVLINYRR